MLAVSDDMTVFFNADFCSDWVRQASPGVAEVQFPAMLGELDAEALQGYTLNAQTELSYITSDVDLHDQQTLLQVGSTTLWRVLAEPVRTNDGATSLARIGRVPA